MALEAWLEGVQVVQTVFVILFVISTVLVGLWAERLISDPDEYYGATKLFGAAVITLASMSGIMSAFGFIGGPGLVYQMGTSSLYMTFAAGLGFAMAYWMVGKRVRGIADAADIGTLPDIVDERFESPLARGLLALILFIACISYLASQVAGGGYVLSVLLGVNMEVAVWIVFGAIILYIAFGGMAAAQLSGAYTGAVMLVGAAGAVVGFFQVAGGMTEVTMTAAAAGEVSNGDIVKTFTPQMLDGFGLAKASAPGLLLIWPIVFSVGVVGQPQVLQRMYSIDNPEGLRTVGLISGVTYAVGSLLWMLIGFAALHLVADGTVEPMTDPDFAALQFVEQLHIGIQLIIYAGLVAAIMSTAGFFLSVASGVIARDFVRMFGWNLSENRQTWVGRITTLVIGVISVLFGLYGGHLVAILGTFGWGTFVSGTFPAIVIGLLWKDCSREGVIAGLLTAVLLNVVLLIATQIGFEFPIGMDFYFIAIVAAVVVTVGVSLVTTGASGENMPDKLEPVFDL
ncbi:sodium:solute symporter family transporter [Halopiger aswanensis]|uniref:Na+/proline symporter n=1 Tax=Halopiger aswanensis TaxID=148449 RepID=A0A419W1M0_9EURY|nr:sodium:proline symporter [Halopiger aswanensis]RKD89304.1 Na+/proline symporter [Halopiger aswanensis]